MVTDVFSFDLRELRCDKTDALVLLLLTDSQHLNLKSCRKQTFNLFYPLLEKVVEIWSFGIWLGFLKTWGSKREKGWKSWKSEYLRMLGGNGQTTRTELAWVLNMLKFTYVCCRRGEWRRAKVPEHQPRGFHAVQLRGPGGHPGNGGVSSNVSAEG